MSFKKLKEMLNQLSEGLNKNEYNKLLDGLNLGVELEVITNEEASADPEDVYMYVKAENLSCLQDLQEEVKEVNNKIYEFKNQLEEYGWLS